MTERIITFYKNNPSKLFLTDSIGALVTASFLFFILRTYNDYFGMPIEVLNWLAALALCFMVYSAFCFFSLNKNQAPFLFTISIVNLLYCVLTLILMIMHHASLTSLGFAYFVAEILVILGLVAVEFKVALSLKL